MHLSRAKFLAKVALQLGSKPVYQNRKWSSEFPLTVEVSLSLMYPATPVMC